ncbi:uncharacterized protein FA14DRAFT_27886 [Meira miltonrushii]|uniref:Alpha/beta-hydrolase n=1 Tax=Meira miltonrushii TaxID=1280837 RepID=A0A316VMP2_9BASI|nr:uncharacterized protein FA14DRAFT_27886 [Meira miltonrushii]PWN38564.1 hypothetical protein FA14DRAFT_27886 [Meira miltonrushii]
MSNQDPRIYLSQGRFHRSVRCPRTQQLVTFGLVGDWSEEYNNRNAVPSSSTQDDRVILFVLPSGCLRYVAILLDGILKASKRRMIAIDRPGAGGTPPCERIDRMQLSTKHTLSVLEYMHIDRVDILTHSAGWFYALNLIATSPSLFLRKNETSKWIFCSPFVPTHISGSFLSILPKSVIGLAPQAGSALNYIGKAFSWSVTSLPDNAIWSKDEEMEELMRGGKKTAEQEQKDDKKREQSKIKYSKARFHPPYRTHRFFGLDQWKKEAAVARTKKPSLSLSDVRPKHPRTQRAMKSADELWMDYMTMENVMKAATEDFLFCLGKVEGMNNETLDQWTQEKLSAIAQLVKDTQGSSIESRTVWGDNDLFIPQKGKTYLAKILEKEWSSKEGITVKDWIMAESGHDSPLASREVVEAMIEFYGE